MLSVLSLLLCCGAAKSAAELPWPSVHAQIQSARDLLSASFRNIDQRSHLGPALEERLDGELVALTPANKPDWLTDSDYFAYAQYVARLDQALIQQLASGHAHALGSIRGADDVTFVSEADGTQQPLAVFVPPSYDGRPVPLVIFLHGYTQTEADEVASPWIRQAAIASGAIVAAPFARGDAHYAPGAPQRDVFQTVALMRKAFQIDPHRIYLAGHSMGGFGIFDVGPVQPQLWAGFLCASGAMTESNRSIATRGLAGKPVYVVEGSADDVVPVSFARRTASLLASAGIAVRYYEQKGGRHSLGTIAPSFEQAWSDMLNGVTATTPIPAADAP